MRNSKIFFLFIAHFGLQEIYSDESLDTLNEIVDSTVEFENHDLIVYSNENKKDDFSLVSNKLESANKMYNAGFYAATGGVIGIAASNFVPGIGSLSGLSFMVGLPVMGVAANHSNGIATQMLPQYKDPGSGWGYYATGIVLSVAGSTWFIYELITNLNPEFIGPVPIFGIINNSSFILPVITIFTGLGFEGLSWYKFSKRHQASRIALHKEFKLSLKFDKTGDPEIFVRTSF